MNNKVVLRPIESSDATQIALLANNVKVSAYLRDSFPSPYSLKDAVDWIDFCHQLGSGSSHPRAITYQGKFVGGIGVIGQDDVYRNSAEIGCWLGARYWFKG